MDDSAVAAAEVGRGGVCGGVWLGVVVPKRHAKRAVTRTMMKRQIKSAMAAVSTSIPQGLWVVRLRAPFDRGVFKSATSPALIDAVKVELRSAFERALVPRAGRS